MENIRQTKHKRATIVLDTAFLAARPYAGLIIKNIRERLSKRGRFVSSSSAKPRNIWITNINNIYPYRFNADVIIATVDYNIETLPPTLVTAANRYADEIWVWDSKTAESCKNSGIAPYKIHMMNAPLASEKTAQEVAARIETIITNLKSSQQEAAIDLEERRWFANQNFKPAPVYIAEKLKKAA